MPSSRKPSTHPVRPVARKDAAAVGKLRALCLAFPEANERRSHGEPTWFAGKGKVFAMLDNHHHGSKHLAVWLPMPPGLQEWLIDTDPERHFRPPYVGPAGWVGVVLDGRTRWDLVEKLLREAFVHVAGARLRDKLLSPVDAPRGGGRESAPRTVRRASPRVSPQGRVKAWTSLFGVPNPKLLYPEPQ
ncbi:MAG TPA: MmcQ/YjbR family DNA-binding protein [Myxococcaceae bacterium]|nr:MmcQ/YjbR family DNA-binding protein [Myxococcaceae bacterium]